MQKNACAGGDFEGLFYTHPWSCKEECTLTVLMTVFSKVKVLTHFCCFLFPFNVDIF